MSNLESIHAGLYTKIDQVRIPTSPKNVEFKLYSADVADPENVQNHSSSEVSGRSTPTSRIVTRLCRAGLSAHVSPFSVRSILISGPKGSGKSFSLEVVLKNIHKFVPDCQLIRVNMQLCDSEEFMERDYIEDRSDAKEEVFKDHLMGLLRLFSSSESHWNPSLPLLVCLETADAIFSNASLLAGESLTENDESPAEDHSPVFKMAAVKLRQLLSLLSQPDFPFPVVVLATTSKPFQNIPGIFSGAPGFEKVIEVPKPTKDQRQKILKHILSSQDTALSSLPESFGHSSVSIEAGPEELLNEWASRLSSMTPGSLPGDLVSIVQKSFEITIGGSYDLDGCARKAPRILTWKSILKALSDYTPSQLRGLDLSDSIKNSTKLSWESFGGYNKEKNYLKRLLSVIQESSKFDTATEQLRTVQASPKGLLITGLSGCGKTFLARILASEANMNFLYIKSNELLSSYLGQTEAKVRSIFQNARLASPCVLFFDDFDVIACRRVLDDGGGQSSLNARVLSTFLNEIDGISSSQVKFHHMFDDDSIDSDTEVDSERPSSQAHDLEQRVFVIAACRDESILDDALLRPGRLYHKVRLDKPTEDDLCEILNIRMMRYPVDKTISSVQLSKTLFENEATGADVDDLCNRAAMIAIRNVIEFEQSSAETKELGNRFVNSDHFESAIREKYRVSIFKMIACVS